jgi:hypothetical protein
MIFKNIHINVLNTKTDFFLHNIAVLYFFCFLSFFYLFYLAFSNNITAVIIYGLVGFITSFFTKNMIVIFFIALTFTGIITLSDLSLEYSVEGFEDTDKEQEPEQYKKDDSEKDDSEKEKEQKEEPEKKKKPTKLSEEFEPTNDTDLDKIQEQTKQILDTHNDLLKNLEKIQPYLQQVEQFTDKFASFK